ncbi:MAG: rod-binding protein [Armatimonadota bacterium]|nr:rod-binding protein [Armatimonadota bacterium]
MRVEPNESLQAQRWQLREATRQVEAQFWHQLLRAMRRTLPTHSSSYTVQMYTDLMDETLAQQLARTSQLGIGRLLYEKLGSHLQDATEGVGRERP